MERPFPLQPTSIHVPDHQASYEAESRDALGAQRPFLNAYWYWGRPSNDDLRRDLREMFEKISPDWDISDPELKAAWERGERDRFFPYRVHEGAKIAS